MSYSKALLRYFGEDEDVAQYAAGLVADASVQLEDLAEMLAELGDWNICSEAALARTKEIRELSEARSKDAASGYQCHPLTGKPDKSPRKSRRLRKGRKAEQKGGKGTHRRFPRSEPGADERAGEEEAGPGSASSTKEPPHHRLTPTAAAATAPAPATTAAQVARAQEAAAAVSQAAAASQAEAGPVRRARAALGALSSHEAPVRGTGATLDSATALLARIHESRCSSGYSASREAVAAAKRLVEMVGTGAATGAATSSSGSGSGSATGLGLAVWALQRAGGSPDEAAMLMLGAASGVTSAAGSSRGAPPKGSGASGASGGMGGGDAGGPGLGEVAPLPDWVPPSGEDGVTSAAGPGGGEPLEQYRGWLWRRWHARRRELICSLEESRKEERAHERVLARFGSSRPLAAGVDVAGEEAEQAKQAARRARRKGKGKEKAPTQLWLDSRGRMVRSAIGHAKSQAKQVRKQMRRLDAQHGGGMRFLDGKVVSREGDKFV